MESVTALLVVVLGLVTSLIMVGVRKAATILNQLPPIVRTLIVVAIATPVAMLGGWLGMDLPGDPTAWDGVTINAILTALMAMGAHAAGKAIAD